jgi:fumarate reductase flavoprotein subunit
VDWHYDVIVVGGGGAGLSAAIKAHERGARCIVLEADRKLGGATMLAGGVFYAAGTSVQRAAGIVNDTPDAMFEYVMTLNQWAVRPDLIRIMADLGAEYVDWLIALGTEFPPEWLVCSGVESVPRGHASRGAGTGVAGPLVNRAGALGIETAVATRVESLIQRDGRVVGVRAGGMDLYAPTTIITTGGFGNSAEMRGRLFPSAAFHGHHTWAVHEDAPYILGDGIRMAEALGADIVGYDSGLLLATSGFMHSVEPFLPPWLMIVNEQGVRFMSETAYYAVSGYLLNEQTGRHAFAIFDEPTMLEAGTDTRHADPYNTGMPVVTWNPDMIRENLAKGRVRKAGTLAELATLCGINVLTLEQTVARYNADCREGHDGLFFKKAFKHFAVEKAPFYAVEIRPAIIGLTAAGLDIDAQCHVLDRHKRPIPGLFAAGEVLGCIHGKRYAGGGMAIANAIIFGGEAGIRAAVEVEVLKA